MKWKPPSPEELDQRTVAFKTVDIFSGVCNRKLFLKPSRPGEGAFTNGHVIQIPFENPNHYTILEHEIGHILFRSNGLAKAMFVRDYVAAVSNSAQAQGVSLNWNRLTEFLADLINILEDRRVNSLWSLLFPGSAVRLAEINHQLTQPYLPHSDTQLLTFILCLSAGHDFAVSHPFHKFETHIRSALSQVERRGFASTLALSKWLVARLLDALIEQMKEKQRSAVSSPFEPEPSNEPPENKEDDEQEQEQGQQQEKEQEKGNEAGNQPQETEPNSPMKERSEAIKDLVERVGSLPPNMKKVFDDFKENEFASFSERKNAENMARTMLQTDPGDGSSLDTLLKQDQQDMYDVVRRARATVRAPQEKDNYLRHGAQTKVVLKSVARAPSRIRLDGIPQALLEEAERLEKQETRTAVEEERLKENREKLKPSIEAFQDRDRRDQDTVRHLRSVFNRVLGRRRASLEYTGTQVDIQALIERRMSGQDVPIFKDEAPGNGFEALVLIDQSGSMEGQKMNDANRACRILNKSLKHPNVTFKVWGFGSTVSGDESIVSGVVEKQAAGEVHIDRFAADTDDYGDAKQMVTPLHTAVYLARRELEASTNHRHLFVVTDGMPTFVGSKGRHYRKETLEEGVRRDVLLCKKRGIQVTGIIIGEDLEAARLSFMFGNTWRRLTKDLFGKVLVDLVTKSVLRYLQRN